MTERIHFSAKPIKNLFDAPFQLHDVGFKPPGFWWSCDGDWERWCAAEDFDNPSEKLRYSVRFGSARILKLPTPQSVLKLTKDFCIQGNTMMIAWPALATVYDGIEITPYHGSLRLNRRCRWYYPWDCASGVCWNASKLSVKLIEPALAGDHVTG